MTIIAATSAEDLTYAVADMLHEAVGDAISDIEFADIVDQTVSKLLAYVTPSPEAA